MLRISLVTTRTILNVDQKKIRGMTILYADNAAGKITVLRKEETSGILKQDGNGLKRKAESEFRSRGIPDLLEASLSQFVLEIS